MILLTGGNGFLGRYISNEITTNSIEVRTLGRGTGNDIICDLSNDIPNLFDIYDAVIHCCGKAHVVPVTHLEEQSFFDVNVKGTRNLLESLDKLTSLPKSFLFISTVAVYGKAEGTLIDEKTELLASDPYGLSKIQAEYMIKEWCESRGVIYTIFRLPLIVGAQPPGNLRKMILGIKKGFYFNIGGGGARKSMVLATDVAKIIPKALTVGGVFNLTDRYHPSFSELSLVISTQLGKKKPLSIPSWLAKIIALIGDSLGEKFPLNSKKLTKIESNLTFSDLNAVNTLGWKPKSIIKDFKIN
ncbi:NAD-dependent epimerase/dehydratase family protein [Pedobacter gandavensis]|uniref:NAD-dependent epimerase/dehydratase family protein n=1 Tax=Pedobacter gandavensis TaxID=2679963 RepID=UPI002479AE75|nr:NAD-dependent epimerase/dehydratase family protein [Pedobacter gandavensis]WGQ07507.1 NAD-dependent epimerase/dehydratase family protein [Pedobacter gandavensis]